MPRFDVHNGRTERPSSTIHPVCVTWFSSFISSLSLSLFLILFLYMDGQKSRSSWTLCIAHQSTSRERESFTISFCFVSLCPVTVELIISSTCAVSGPFLRVIAEFRQLERWNEGRRSSAEEKNQFFSLTTNRDKEMRVERMDRERKGELRRIVVCKSSLYIGPTVKHCRYSLSIPIYTKLNWINARPFISPIFFSFPLFCSIISAQFKKKKKTKKRKKSRRCDCLASIDSFSL